MSSDMNWESVQFFGPDGQPMDVAELSKLPLEVLEQAMTTVMESFNRSFELEPTMWAMQGDLQTPLIAQHFGATTFLDYIDEVIEAELDKGHMHCIIGYLEEVGRWAANWYQIMLRVAEAVAIKEDRDENTPPGRVVTEVEQWLREQTEAIQEGGVSHGEEDQAEED